MKRAVIIRADSSQSLGSGHMMRCRVLAQALRSSGYEVAFFSRQAKGSIDCSDIASHYWLESSASVPSDDAQILLEIIHRESIEPLGVILDHYELGPNWFESLSQNCGAEAWKMVIDDFGGQAWNVDLLLNQNYLADYESIYSQAKAQQKLLGPKYALLRPKFLEIRPEVFSQKSSKNHGFLSLGGSDPDGHLLNILKGIAQANLKQCRWTVATGAVNPHLSRLGEQIDQLKNLGFNMSLKVSPKNLEEIMRDCDFSIGAGGSMNWERMSLGLPTLVVSIAPNQVQICQDLDQAGFIKYCGDAKNHNVESWVRNLTDWMETPCKIMNQMAQKGYDLVDGKGASRVVEALSEL